MDGVKRIVRREGHRLLVEMMDGDTGWIEDAERKAGSKRLRRMDLVEKLFRESEIGKPEVEAARRYEEIYEASCLRPRYPAMNFEGRVSATGGADGAAIAAMDDSFGAQGEYFGACRAIGAYASTTLTDVLCNDVRITDYPKQEQPRRRTAVVCGLQALAAYWGMA